MNKIIEDIDYPQEALLPGTLVRSIKKDRLGMVADAYYGDLDKNKKKIIVYTILLIPDKRDFSYLQEIEQDRLYMINEYEYDIYAYLMIPPLNFNAINESLGGVI
jgi:hypothetical protein|tara:strand:+ start:171 stop:485 length:315 start_codon:yes stop_codon:yes gene_type:complete